MEVIIKNATFAFVLKRGDQKTILFIMNHVQTNIDVTNLNYKIKDILDAMKLIKKIMNCIYLLLTIYTAALHLSKLLLRLYHYIYYFVFKDL